MNDFWLINERNGSAINLNLDRVHKTRNEREVSIDLLGQLLTIWFFSFDLAGRECRWICGNLEPAMGLLALYGKPNNPPSLAADLSICYTIVSLLDVVDCNETGHWSSLAKSST